MREVVVKMREVVEWPYERYEQNTKEVQIRIRLNAYRINIPPTDSFDSSIGLFIVHISFARSVCCPTDAKQHVFVLFQQLVQTIMY